MSLYNLFSYCFNTDGIDYENVQNELMYKIQEDVAELIM